MSFHGLCALLLPILVAVAGGPLEKNYTLLTGAALKAFEKSGGASQAGNLVALNLPGGVVDPSNVKALDDSAAYVVFSHKGVEYVAERDNPYLVQTQRKLEGRPSPIVLLKGLVSTVGRAKEKRVAVVVHTTQLLDKRLKKPAAKKKT
jgi:hypothetical protein